MLLLRLILVSALLLSLAACSSPPRNPDNICDIFREKDWYEDAADARDRWGSPISTTMAIMYHESSFRAKAKPPRTYLLGFIPWFRASNAYGYAQAKTGTWRGYQSATGRHGADRDDFDDAIDFIAWYNHRSVQQCSIRSDDTYHLYLAYHEGHGGFNRRSFRNKEWLKAVARKVSARSITYRHQLAVCEESLKKPWWQFW